MVDPTRWNIKQVAAEINQNEKLAKNWIEKKRIPINDTGREKYVSKFIVEFQLQLELVEDLMQLFPLNWHVLYEICSTDEKIMKAVFEKYPPVSIQGKTKLKSTNHFK